MLRKKRVMLAWLLMLPVLLTGCFKSETVVKRVDPNKPLEKLDGVHYSLPRTVVKAAIPIKKTDEKPGALESFTPCFFPADIANERIREMKTTYSIEEPTFAYRIEPDPGEHFVVSVKGGYFEKKSLLLDYLPGGIISKGTAESTNEALEFTLKAIKTGTSIVTGFAGIPNLETGDLDTATHDKVARNRRLQDYLTDEEKKALNCFRQKARVATLEKDEAKKAETEAKTAEEKLAAGNTLKKAEKRETEAQAEKLSVEEYLFQEAGERKNDRDADRAMQNEEKAKKPHTQKQSGRSRTRGAARTSNESPESGGISRESEGSGNNNTPQEITDSTSRGSEGENPPGEQARGAKSLPPRTPETPENKKNDNYQAEKLLDDYQRAQATFKDIERLGEKRIALVSGGAETNSLPPETLKEMLTQIDKTLEERKSLFFGSKAEKPWTANFEYRPEANLDTQTSRPLLWFAEGGDLRGLCPTPESVEQGIIIPKNFKGKNCGTDSAVTPAGMNVIYLNVAKNLDDQPFRDQLKVVQQKFENEKKKRGWYYRIPAKAVVMLKVGKLSGAMYAMGGGDSLPPPLSGNDRVPITLGDAREMRRSTLDIAQLGVTVSAPASGAGRTNQSTIEYDDFGAIKNFKYASDPLLQKSYLDEVQGTAQSIIDARTKSIEAKKERAEASAAANDPLAKMKRELEILETRNKINKEKEKLEQGGDEEDEDAP